MKRFIIMLLLLFTGIQAQITIPTYASETDGFRLLGVGNDSLGLNPAYWMRYNSNIWDLNNAIISVNFQNTAYRWGSDETVATHMIEGENLSLMTNDLAWTPASPDDNFVTLPGFEFRVRTNDSLLIWDTSLNVYRKASVFEVMNGDSIVPGYTAITPTLSSYDNNLVTAIAAMGSSDTTLVIDSVPDTITSNLTIPSNIDLKWYKGCKLIAEALTDTVRIEGTIDAGSYAIFDTSVFIYGNSNIDRFNLKWYGATGDGSTNDTPYIQKAFTLVTRFPKVSATLYCPSGVYNFTNLILADSTSSVTQKGYINIIGERVVESPESNRLGTIFKCTSTTGNNFVVNNEETPANSGERAQRITLKDFGVKGNTDGILFTMQSVSNEPIVENIRILNSGSGVGAYFFNMWTGMIRNLQVTGGGKTVSDVAFWYDTEDGAGSMITFENCTFSKAKVAMRVGPDPDTHSGAVEVNGIGNNAIFTAIQPKSAQIGLQLYAGAQVNAYGWHFEDNDSSNVQISHGSTFNVKDSYLGIADRSIEIIPDLVTSRGNRLFIKNSRMFNPGGAHGRTIWVKDSSRVEINIDQLHNNIAGTGDTLIVFEGDFFGKVNINSISYLGAQNAADPLSNRPEWIINPINLAKDAAVIADTVDFSNINYMPRNISVTGTNLVLIALPGNDDDAELKQKYPTTIMKRFAGGAIVLDANYGAEASNAIIVDGVAVGRDTITTQYEVITLIPIQEAGRVYWNTF